MFTYTQLLWADEIGVFVVNVCWVAETPKVTCYFSFYLIKDFSKFELQLNSVNHITLTSNIVFHTLCQTKNSFFGELNKIFFIWRIKVYNNI